MLLVNPLRGATLGCGRPNGNGALIDIDFLSMTGAHSRETFTRSTTAWGVNAAGIVVSTAINAPVYEWDPVTLAKLGRRIEGLRTNLLLRSQEFDNASWTKRGTCTIGANDATAPDATLTADLVTLGVNGQDLFQPGATVTDGARAEPSFFIKRVSTSGTLRVTNPNDGTRGTWLVDMSLLPDAWTRVTRIHAAVTITTEFTGAAGNVCGVHFYRNDAGTLSFHLWGAQLEVGSISSSYIPTTTGAISRSADSGFITLTAAEKAILDVQGTFYAEFSFALAASDVGPLKHAMACCDTTTANGHFLYNGGGMRGLTGTGGVNQALPTIAGALAAGSIVRVAHSYANNSVQFSRNGALGTRDVATPNGMPPLTRIGIGNRGDGMSENLFGHIRRIAVFPTPRTDAQLQSMTTSGI